MQPAIIRSWFQRSTGRAGYDARPSSATRHPDVLLELHPGRPAVLLEQPPADDALEVAGQAGLEHRRLAALRVQEQVERVGQHRAAQHPGVVVGHLGDGEHLGPPLRVALQVDQHLLHPRQPGPGPSRCRGTSTPGSPLVHQVQPDDEPLEGAPGLAAYVLGVVVEAGRGRRRRARCRRRRPGSRMAWARTRGSSWVARAAAPSPAPPTSRRVGDLEAHLGGSPVRVGQPGDHRGRRALVPRRGAARGHPRSAPSGRPSWPGRGGATRPRRTARSGRAARGGGPRRSAPCSRSTHTGRPPAARRGASASSTHQPGHGRLQVARRRAARSPAHHARPVRPGRQRYRAAMTTADVASLLERARAWAAEDPDDGHPRRARRDRRRRRRRRRPDRPGRPVRRHAGVRHRRPARRARRRAQPDEPGRGRARRGRPRGVPPGPGRAPRQLRRDRLRRPPQLRRLRPGHRRGDDRRRVQGAACSPGRCRPRCWPSRSASSAAWPA